jgi:putative oxidoreductase
MKKWIERFLSGIPAVSLRQTLFFTVTAAPESVALFEQLGLEPYGRIGIGVLELIAAGLLLIPRWNVFGAVLGDLLMGGALMSHVTTLGFAGDMGSLAVLALIVLACCAGVLIRQREQIQRLLSRSVG